jgi:predicted Zn-dependent protease
MKLRKYLQILLGILLIAAVVAGFFTTTCRAESAMLKFEKEIGLDSYQQIIREKKVVQLPEAKARALNEIFNRVVSFSSRRNELNFSLTVLDDPEINAFSLPAGYIFINTGLLNVAANDGEIAGVLGHEIAHVDHKDGFNAVSRAMGLTLILNMVSQRVSSPELAAKIGNTAINLAQNGYSRKAEYAADASGAKYMIAAGYSKMDMINFFHKLESQEGSGKPSFAKRLLSNHPPTRERIKRLEKM